MNRRGVRERSQVTWLFTQRYIAFIFLCSYVAFHTLFSSFFLAVFQPVQPGTAAFRFMLMLFCFVFIVWHITIVPCIPFSSFGVAYYIRDHVTVFFSLVVLEEWWKICELNLDEWWLSRFSRRFFLFLLLTYSSKYDNNVLFNCVARTSKSSFWCDNLVVF